MVDCYFDIETTGLNPYKDTILTIQLKRDHDVVLWKIWEKDELSAILKFLKYLRTVSSSDSIYGYNILKFDVPFISARLNIYGQMNSENYSLLHNKKWIDLYQYLGDNYVPLDKWLQKFAIKRLCPFTGKDIPRLYEKKKFEEIEDHAKDDLIVCEKLVEKMRFRQYIVYIQIVIIILGVLLTVVAVLRVLS